MSSTSSRELALRWLLALGCFALLIFFFSPSWDAFYLWSRVPEMGGMLEVRRGVAVLAQVAHPGAPISDPLHQAIQWRLLFPLIGHILHLPPVLFFALADVGCIVVLGTIISLLRRNGWTWGNTTLGCLSVAAASWFFVATGWLGYFDSWLALALLIVAFAEHRGAVWAACLCAPWIDERFVIALPVALLCRWLYAATRAPAAAPAAFRWRLEWAVPAALTLLFLIVRLGLLADKSAGNATLVGYFTGKNYLDAPLSRILLGVWEGLRGGWVFVIAAVLWLRHAPTRAAALGIAVVLTIAVGLATAQDYSRSMTMLLPVAVLGLLAIPAMVDSRRSAILGGVTAITLLLPAHHVMSDAVNPIMYLYHELAAFDSPPPAAMPELRELAAIHAMEEGDFARAERELTLAIKLAPNPASAAKRRGMLYASAKRWDEARRDFTTVVENEPESPEGWYLRSEVEIAVRDIENARADFEHARALAPTDWITRPDVARFATLFNQQTARP